MITYLLYSIFISLPRRLERSQLMRNLWLYGVKRSGSKIGNHVTVNGRVKGINRNVTVGDYANFNGLTIIGGGTLTIGNYFHSGKDIVIITESHNFENAESIPYDKKRIKRPVVIGDYVFIGHGSILMGPLSVGEGAIVAAGSVVVKDVPSCAMVGGNPAKVIKFRDLEHFRKLKAEQKFF